MPNTQPERLSIFREATMRTASTFRPTTGQSILRRSYNYKPSTLRTIPLVSLFLLTVALVGVLEYVVEKLPHSSGTPLALGSSTSLARRNLHYRNDSTSDTISYVLATPTTTSVITSASVTTTDSSLVIAASAAQSDYISTSYQQTVTAVAAQSDYLSTSYQQTITVPSADITSSTESSDYLNTDYTETLAYSVQSSDYLNTDYTVTVSTTSPTPTGSAAAGTTLTTPAAATITRSAQVITSSTASIIIVPVSSGSPQSADGAVVALGASRSVSGNGVMVAPLLATVSLTAVTVTSGSSTFVQTQGVATISGSVTTISSMSSVVSQFAQSTVNVQVLTTVTPSPTATATATPGAAVDASSMDADHGSGKTYTMTYRFSVQQTFLGTYCAIAIAVIYRMLWTILYNDLNLIEPFRQLAEPNGALAERAFFTFYQAQSSLLGPILALLKRRYLMALTATAYSVACLLPALASESVYVDTRWDCPTPKVGQKNPCPARLTADLLVVRILQACLAFIALAILVLAFILLIRKTGLPASPSSIATIASLMRNPALLEDLQEVPAEADTKSMQKMLTGKRFRLEHYKAATGDAGYGIVPVSLTESDSYVTSSASGKRFEYVPVQTSVPQNDEQFHTHRWRFLDYVLALVVAGTFGVLLAYYLDGTDDGFNSFFSSNTFGPRFILAGAGTIVAALWKSVEQSEVIMAPYNRLARRASAPRSTISFTPHTTPIVSTLQTISHGYLFVAAVTCVTLLGEAANICLVGVPYATGQTWQQFLASIYISMGVFAIMIIMSIAVIISRTREPRIPRKPDTLGAVMSYLSGSRMLDDFEGSEALDEETRDRRLRLLGKKYDFKVATRRDGKYAWAVDDNLARSSYQS